MKQHGRLVSSRLRQWLAALCFVGGTLSLAAPSAAQQARPGRLRQLNELVSQLKSEPSNGALRLQIIKLALAIHPKPPVPEKANEAFGAGKYAFGHAQSKADYALAAQDLEKAALLAPWVASAYYDLAMAEEKAGQYDNAIASYRLYRLAAPQASDRAAVEQRIGADKTAKQMAAERQQAAEQHQQQEQEQKQQQAAQQMRQQEAEQQQQSAQQEKSRFMLACSETGFGYIGMFKVNPLAHTAEWINAPSGLTFRLIRMTLSQDRIHLWWTNGLSAANGGRVIYNIRIDRHTGRFTMRWGMAGAGRGRGFRGHCAKVSE